MRKEGTPPNKSTAHLPAVLERFRVTLGLPADDWLSLLEMKPDDYARIVRGEEDAPLRAFVNLTEPCGVTLESIMRNDVDFAAVSAHLAGNDSYMPERYSEGAFSKRRASLNLLNYIEQFYGWEVRTMALRRLQVSESIFKKPDELINIHFQSDLSEFLAKYHAADHDFFSMGAYSVISFRESPVGKQLQTPRNVSEMYQLMVEELVPRYVENNCTYHLISMDHDGCVIDVVPNPDVLEALRVKNFGNDRVCMTKMGIMAAVPAFQGFPLADVEETRCLHRGNATCRFEIEYEAANRVHSQVHRLRSVNG